MSFFECVADESLRRFVTPGPLRFPLGAGLVERRSQPQSSRSRLLPVLGPVRMA